MQQEETPNDSTQTAVLVLLFSALVTLVIFVIILYSSRRKLKRVIKVKTGIMKSKSFSLVLIMFIMIINFISNNLDTWVMNQFCIHVDIHMYIREHKVSTKKKKKNKNFSCEMLSKKNCIFIQWFVSVCSEIRKYIIVWKLKYI